ncbi:hypothetical protein ABD91_26010 [Lysinibacillus sphaericus]|uniref:hypothetical protein n=1 Tax=Lysinibacillus sphaericus TaxID=1421 RepID=UPI0018CD1BF0|nr:hypothetical protein [Lysinibacillus sphaericus]MBG9694188.1 hypothetical protein [Lysinibacillus sphaericus]
MENLHAREVLGLTMFILIALTIVFLASHKVFVESETEKGSIIQEIKFKDNLIDYVIIDKMK